MRTYAMLFAGILGVVSVCLAAPTNEMSAPEAGDETRERSQMSHMAQSMSAMADTCKMMMEKEMASRPMKIAAFAVIGVLGTLALLLLVVLEVQWIRWWNLKIRAQKSMTG